MAVATFRIRLKPARAGSDAVAAPRGRNLRAGTAILNLSIEVVLMKMSRIRSVISRCFPDVGVRLIAGSQRQRARNANRQLTERHNTRSAQICRRSFRKSRCSVGKLDVPGIPANGGVPAERRNTHTGHSRSKRLKKGIKPGRRRHRGYPIRRRFRKCRWAAEPLNVNASRPGQTALRR